MDCDESYLTLNEKTQPIQCTKEPTDALVAIGSLWPGPAWAPPHQGPLL